MNIYEMPHDWTISHPELPKAALIRVCFRGFSMSRIKPSKIRFANAARLEWFGIEVIIRRPWLVGSARQLHPHLFGQNQ